MAKDLHDGTEQPGSRGPVSGSSSNSLHAAVLALQSEIGTLQKNALNPHFKSRYLSLDSLMEHVQPLLTKHGLIWNSFPTQKDGVPVLLYVLTHVKSGENCGSEMPLLLEKQNAQGLGSAITYARRYALCAVLNIVADVDDDGGKASKQKKFAERVSPGDLAAIRAAVKPPTLADQLRGKKKGAEIKKFVSDELGATLDDVGVTADDLIKYLNDLDPEAHVKVLAWANG